MADAHALTAATDLTYLDLTGLDVRSETLCELSALRALETLRLKRDTPKHVQKRLLAALPHLRDYSP